MSRQIVTRLLSIGMIAWVLCHLVLILLYDTVTIYENVLAILVIEIVAVSILLLLRVGSYIRMLRDTWRKR